MIRAKEELARAAESPQHPIPLPLFIFLLCLAGLLDVFGAIPVLGTILNALLGPIIWLVYYFVGAKGLAAVVRWIAVFLMAAGFFSELLPAVQAFPINTVVAITVYLIMHPKAAEAFERAKAMIGRAARFQKAAAVAKKVLPVAKKVIQQAA